MTKKTDKPIGPTEEQFMALAKAVIAVERAGPDDQPRPAGGIRVASLAELKSAGWDQDPRTGGKDAAGAARTALFCIND